MELRDLEKRIQEIEDLEAIKTVIAKYCYYVDQRRLEDLMELFHQNAQVNVGPMGEYKGKGEIRKFYGEVVPQINSDAWHLVHNQIIEIKGGEATSCAYFEVNAIQKGEAIVGAGIYEDKLVKEAGQWFFILRDIRIDYMGPLKEGWGKKGVAL
jgi:hypothetical protein